MIMRFAFEIFFMSSVVLIINGTTIDDTQRKIDNSTMYIATAIIGVMANIKELANMRGTVINRYRMVPKRVS